MAGTEQHRSGLGHHHDRPNLTKLRRFLEGGAAGLVIKAVQAYSERVMPDWEAEAAAYLEKAKTVRVRRSLSR